MDLKIQIKHFTYNFYIHVHVNDVNADGEREMFRTARIGLKLQCQRHET